MNNTVNMNDDSNIVRGEFRRGILARTIDRIKGWNERRIAIRQLGLLSDRMLNDIGIDRYEIPSVVSRQGASVHIGTDQSGKSTVSTEYRHAA